jgi:tetratricopeptide (TPR) repeat protein
VQEVSLCLAGTREAAAICDPLSSFISATEISDHSRADREIDSVVQVDADLPRVTINSSQKPDVVKRLVLSLFTLGSFGDGQGNVNTSGTVVSVLPFVENVAACYLFHGSDEVRRAAALTCCTLLVLPEGDSRASPTATDQISCLGSSKHIGTGLNRVVEAVLKRLLRVATSDPSPVVRLCVIRALDSRYDAFLCQTHHLQALFMVLEDEVVAARASGLKLLGRLVRLNPAPVLPVMRKFLVDLMVDMRCGGDKRRGREDATRLLEVLLRAEALRRLVQPVLASIINSLPLTEVAPRLASAALETLGELALATGSSLKPWIHQLVPQIMETMQDQSSVSKQLISLRTLGQISGSTGYVISPYLDYPQLLSQAADVLPGTKRAPWALRREVIRTLGILGALDPDKYNSVVPTTRKGGAAGGAYFLEQDDSRSTEEIAASRSTMTTGPQPNMKEGVPSRENDDDLPAHLFMYEQYAMVAQPVLNVVPPRRITPADEDFYPTVTIQALTRIFKDPSLAVHHGQVLQAIMYIFQSLKLHCVPYLKKVVPHMIYTVKTCGPFALREALLKHLATLSGLVGEHLRPYVADIFDVMDAFWSTRHLAAVLALVSKIAAGVPDEFREYVPRFVQRVLASLSDIHSSDWLMPQSRNETPGSASLEIEKLQLILESLRHLRGVLQDFLHVLIPALLKLAESLVAPSASALGPNGVTQSTLSDTAALTFMTLSALLAHDSSSPSSLETFSSLRSSASFTLGTSLAARATQPLVRLLGRDFNSNGVVGQEIVKTLCVCATQLGPRRWKSLYHEVTRKAICEWEDRIRSYENLQSVRNSTQSVSNEALFGLHLYDQVISSLEIPTGRALRSSSGSTDARAFIYQSLSRQNSLLRPRDPPERLRGFDAASGLNDSSEALDSSITPLLVQGKVNQANLQLAWDVSRRSSKEDWDEWMRKFAIELLREAPSPALRSCAGLAHAYPPLARELFSSAFVCCWADLDDEFRNNLVYSLETAFSADVSPEILQTLLNLAEFMEHGGIEGPLPIDISILADLALKCRAYAKALHYKEREYNEGDVSGACVESLISINSKLDLPEAALGVLKAARIRHESSRLQYSGGAYSSHPPKAVERHMLYSVMTTTDEIQGDREGESWDLFEVQESWLAKLGSFTEALAVYDEKLASNPDNFDAILGSMRCLDATGDWRQVLALAERSWEALAGESQQLDGLADDNMPASFSSQFIYPRERRKALRFCARAAWRLDQWDELEKYASQLVRGEVDPKTSKKTQLVGRRSGDFGESPPSVDFDGAFYTAVLQVHRKEWSLAREAIDAARAAMDSRFTALMAESYKRAYPSMVTAQTLSEMEEIISYRMLEERYAASENRHPINRPDKDKARSELLSIWSDRLAGCREDADVYSSILAVRSLVLDPSDCVDCILTQSELSRQAHRFKLAERVLLEPLTFLGADINGSIFGFGLPESLGLGLVQSHPENPEINASIIDRLVNGESKAFSPKYGTIHERYSAKVVQEAGGLDKYVGDSRCVLRLWCVKGTNGIFLSL